MTLKYRPEIDGLRTIAVIAVIIYHAQFVLAGLDVLSGGFIGVDIFFVISGYLITFIILSDIELNRFTFRNFYERRARRILPALFTVILFSFPVAWIVMLPQNFKDFAFSILSSLAFGSNIWFLQEDSYASPHSLLKPFLHTWSLSVEEQFYVLFPILLLFVYKFFEKYIWTVLIGLFIISLILAEWSSMHNPDAAFYLLPMRGWELLAGAFLAKYEMEKGRNQNRYLGHFMPVIGIICIVYAFITFNDQETRHPSILTIIPVMGTVLLIRFCGGKDGVTRVLSTAPFIWIGLISYSLYLWHFPIFSFARITDIATTDLAKIQLITLTFILSVGTYIFIEQPFRNRNLFQTKYCVLIISLIAFFIICASSVVVMRGGVPERLPPILVKEFTDYPWFRMKNNQGRKCYGTYGKEDFCYFREEKNEKTLIVIGDSNVESLSFDLVPKALSAGYDVVTMNSSACYFAPDFYSVKDNQERRIPDQPCDLEFQKRRMKTIQSHPDATILLGGALDVYLTPDGYSMRNDDGMVLRNEYKKYVRKLLESGYSVIQMTPTPRFGKLVGQTIFNHINLYHMPSDYMTSILSYNEGYYFEYAGDAIKIIEEIDHPDYHIIYTHQPFCDRILPDICVSNDGENLFFIDLNHPARAGARKISDLVIEKLQNK